MKIFLPDAKELIERFQQKPSLADTNSPSIERMIVRCELIYEALHKQFSDLLVKFFEFKHNLEENFQFYKTSVIKKSDFRGPGEFSESPKRESRITFNKINSKLDEILKELEKLSKEYFHCNYNELMNETIKRISYLNQTEGLNSSVAQSKGDQSNDSTQLAWIFLGTTIFIFATFFFMYAMRVTRK
jgi:hypothetical protein